MPELLTSLRACDHRQPTPIQERAIPHLLAGRDLLAIAQTGTGKTAAFGLPLLQRLAASRRRPAPHAPRALILTPTRELAAQIGDSLRAYGARLPLRGTVIFGGVGQARQVAALRRGVDVLVATPGRLLDLFGQGYLDLAAVEVFVLDEADRMLDMGFVHDVRRVIAELPAQRQSSLFSATMPPAIAAIARDLLRDPLRVEAAPPSTTVERVEQSVFFVAKASKRHLLTALLDGESIDNALVFARTKHGVDRVAKHLSSAGVGVAALHGGKSQSARERALDGFRDGRVRVLVATDIAARGLDVPGIDHVINFDLPSVPETYVHRIGRTARAGRDGRAISFCDDDERASLRAIEREIRREIRVVPHAFRDEAQPAPPAVAPARPARRGRRRGPAPSSTPSPSRAVRPAKRTR